MFALVADPESALIEYLEMFYNLRQAGTALAKLGVMDFATTIAPGLRDVLLTGKAAEAVRRKDDGGSPVYDAVVMDAPPTGRIGRFLNVTSRGLRAGQGRADPRARRHRAERDPVAADRRALRHACWRRCRFRRPWTASPSCASATAASGPAGSSST